MFFKSKETKELIRQCREEERNNAHEDRLALILK